MRTVAEVNKYVSDSEPWKLKDESQRARLGTILHVAAQAVSDCNLLLAPFLPHAANAVDRVLGGAGDVAPMPELVETDDLDGGRRVPDHHRRLLRSSGLAAQADHCRHADRQARAGVRQARPVGRRRGARPTRRLTAQYWWRVFTSASAPAATSAWVVWHTSCRAVRV